MHNAASKKFSGGARELTVPRFAFVPIGNAHRAHLVRRNLMAAGASAMVVALLYAAYLTDVISMYAFRNAALLTLFFVLAFYVVFRSGFNLRFSDPSQTIPQMLSSTVVTIHVLYESNDGHGILGIRYGGEEFVAILDQTALEGAPIAAARMCALARQLRFDAPESELRVTVSVGGAQYKKLEDWQITVNRADEALYRAKHGGRDRSEIELAHVSN